MTEEEFEKLKKEGKIEEIKEEKSKEIPEEKEMPPTVEDFETILEFFRQFKRHRKTAPTHKPKNFLEQIEFYDDEGSPPTRRLYIYINGGWRYVDLT